MAGLFDKISKAASSAATMAGNKAGEMMEVGKLKSRISSTRQDMGIAMKEIGEYCYGLYEEDKIEDEKIKELCDRIRDCQVQITELEKQIQMAKDQYDAKAGMDSAE